MLFRVELVSSKDKCLITACHLYYRKRFAGSLHHRNPLPEVKSYIDSELRVGLFERFQIATGPCVL